VRPGRRGQDYSHFLCLALRQCLRSVPRARPSANKTTPDGAVIHRSRGFSLYSCSFAGSSGVSEPPCLETLGIRDNRAAVASGPDCFLHPPWDIPRQHLGALKHCHSSRRTTSIAATSYSTNLSKHAYRKVCGPPGTRRESSVASNKADVSVDNVHTPLAGQTSGRGSRGHP
jgi:hypothetical protein